MVVNTDEMLKIEGFDLERKETISARVEFNSDLLDFSVELSMEFPKPKAKQQIQIQHVELSSGGTSGSKGSKLF